MNDLADRAHCRKLVQEWIARGCMETVPPMPFADRLRRSHALTPEERALWEMIRELRRGRRSSDVENLVRSMLKSDRAVDARKASRICDVVFQARSLGLSVSVSRSSDASLPSAE